MRNSDARTIVFAIIFLTVIFAGKITDGINRGEAEGFNDKIVLTSIADSKSAGSVEVPIQPAAVITTVSAPAVTSGEGVIPPAAIPQPPQQRAAEPRVAPIAGIAVTMDGSSDPPWEKNTTQRWPIASLTKLMSAVVIDEAVGLDKDVTITDEDTVIDTNIHELKTGEVFSVADLKTATLLRSSNEAAHAIARFFGMQQFVDAMQTTAAKLGMADTAFFDPTGLSALNQSTVNDLQKLVAYIWNNHPDIFSLSTKKEASILEKLTGARRVMKSTNEFAGTDAFLGGKTGYTDEAHGNLISIFRSAKSPLLIIVLGTDDRFGDTKKILNWIQSR